MGVRRGCRVLALFRFDLIVAERLQDGVGGLLALGWPLVHRLAAVVVLARRLQLCVLAAAASRRSRTPQTGLG